MLLHIYKLLGVVDVVTNRTTTFSRERKHQWRHHHHHHRAVTGVPVKYGPSYCYTSAEHVCVSSVRYPPSSLAWLGKIWRAMVRSSIDGTNSPNIHSPTMTSYSDGIVSQVCARMGTLCMPCTHVRNWMPHSRIAAYMHVMWLWVRHAACGWVRCVRGVRYAVWMSSYMHKCVREIAPLSRVAVFTLRDDSVPHTHTHTNTLHRFLSMANLERGPVSTIMVSQTTFCVWQKKIVSYNIENIYWIC